MNNLNIRTDSTDCKVSMLPIENDIIIKDVDKIYQSSKGNTVQALNKINLSVDKGEFVSIIGPSGCGKSTLLRILAGLDSTTSGEIIWGRNNKNIGFVFQDSTLLPWKNVYENTKFPLKAKKLDTPENLKKLDELIEFAGLKDFKKSYPYELSGGMKQRVSIIRALSYNPDLLLMDEPFGALDAMTRDKMNLELLRIWSERKKTVIFITHSISEAVFLSDRVVVMTPRPGKINKIFDITLPRPRDISIKETLEFINYIKEIRVTLGDD